MEINKSMCIKTILIWEEKFNQYKCYENIIIENINKIIKVHEELQKDSKYEDIDDTDFYIALIENSIFFLTKKLQINKAKLLEDINNVWIKIDPTQNFCVVDRHIFFLLLEQYKILYDNILENQNINKYKWFKTSKLEDLIDLEHHINKLLTFHLTIIKYLAIVSELKINYYC
jgi:hypothetical protein